jgi:uncharacterized membrane protein (UPF0127 family)
MQLLALTLDGQPTGLRLGLAARWYQRAIGLLLTSSLQDPAGLWIKPCNAVHMIGMRYALDLAFVDRDGRVLRLVPALKPWRFAACRSAHAVVELRAGLIEALGLQPGQRLALTPC